MIYILVYRPYVQKIKFLKTLPSKHDTIQFTSITIKPLLDIAGTEVFLNTNQVPPSIST